MRWTGRTSSQRQARAKWVAPDLNRISQKHDVLSQYSHPDYLLGGSTDQGLQRMAWRLKFGEPEPKVKSSSLPELPGDLVSAYELADTDPAAERSLPRDILSSNEQVRELEDKPPIAELEGVPVHTFPFRPTLPKRPIPFTNLTSTEAKSDISLKIPGDLPNTEATNDLNQGSSTHDLNDDLFDMYYHWISRWIGHWLGPFEETYNGPATAIKVAGHLGKRSKIKDNLDQQTRDGSTEFQKLKKKNFPNFQEHEILFRTCWYLRLSWGWHMYLCTIQYTHDTSFLTPYHTYLPTARFSTWPNRTIFPNYIMNDE